MAPSLGMLSCHRLLLQLPPHLAGPLLIPMPNRLEDTADVRRQLCAKKVTLTAQRLKDFIADTGPPSTALDTFGRTTVVVARRRMAAKLDNFDRAFNITNDTTTTKNN